MESQYGSLTKGALALRRQATGSGPLFQTLKSGLQKLIDTLQSRIQGHCNVEQGEVEAVEKAAAGWRLRVGSHWVEAPHVIVASPANQAGRIVQTLDGNLASLLCQIPYNSSVTITIAYNRPDVRHPLNGFGFLVPAKERRRLMACTWVNNKFDHRVREGLIVLRCFMGGPSGEAALDESDEAIESAVRKELGELMEIDAEPAFVRIARWPRSMAQYTVGHQARMQEIEARLTALPGLQLAGNAYYGIGIPDCVRSAKQAAERIAAGLRS
jgi:oxygen-dependent protoporphyrinogen oxidase